MSTHAVVVQGKTVTVRDNLTDYEAALMLQQRVAKEGGTEFERSILQSVMENRVTPARRDWLHYLVSDEYAAHRAARETGPAPAVSSSVASDAKAPAAGGIQLEGRKIMELFDRVKATGLKTPKVFLALGETEIKLSVAPMTGKNPGYLYVTVGADYLGKVSPEGVFRTSRPLVESDDELIALLNKFATDPEGTAKEYGRITSRCCFCGLELSNRNSIWNGYGEICAGHYGVPYEKPPIDWHPVQVVNKAVEGGDDSIHP